MSTCRTGIRYFHTSSSSSSSRFSCARGTKIVWEYVQGRLPKGSSVSRATIVNFLIWMAEDGVLGYEGTTGKGGHYNICARAIDTDLCTGCGICPDSCPVDVIYMGESGKAFARYPEDCVACYSCEKDCPVNAIYVSPQRGRPVPHPW